MPKAKGQISKHNTINRLVSLVTKVERNPQNDRLKLYLANLYLFMGCYQDALDLINKPLDNKHLFFDAIYIKTIAEYKLGNHLEAFESYVKILELENIKPETINNQLFTFTNLMIRKRVYRITKKLTIEEQILAVKEGYSFNQDVIWN